MIDIGEISFNNSEISFIKVVKAFDFLRSEGYRGSSFCIYGKEVPSVEFINDKANRFIKVFWSEIEGKYEVIFEKKNFNIFNSSNDSFELTKCFKKYNIHYTTFGENNTLNFYSEFIRQKLMPIVRGEKWIDQL